MREVAINLKARLLLVTGALIFAAHFSRAASAQTGAPSLPQAAIDIENQPPASFDYTVTAYGQREGAPEVLNITQTPDGFLWLATPQGLVRFDGTEFKLDDHVQKYVRNVAANSKGTIYLSFQFGGVGRITDGHYEDLSAGLPQAPVFRFVFDHTGGVWIGTTAGVFELVGRQWQPLGASRGFPDHESVGAMGVLEDGSLWIIDASVPRKAWLKPPSSTDFHAIDSRELWLALFGIAPADVSNNIATSLDNVLNVRNAPYAFAHDQANVLWTLDKSLQRLYWKADRSGRKFVNDDDIGDLSLLNREVTFGLFADKEGNIWLPNSDGLRRISLNRMRALAPPKTMQSPVLARGKNGDIWIVAYGGKGFYRYADGLLTTWKNGGGHTSALWVDPSDRLWDFCYSPRLNEAALNHIEILDRAGSTSYIDYPSTATGYPIAFAQDPSGGYLLAARSGFYRYKDGTWTSGSGRKNRPNGFAIRLMPDRNGRLWLSWSDGHVGYMDATNAGIFDAKDVSLGPIYAIWPGKAHTWLGGEDGVAFTASNHVTPLWSGTDNPFKTVTGIVETERGELWINAAEGLYRIDQQGVTDLLSGHHPKPASMSLFSQEDGLQGGPGPYAPGPSLFEAGDGRIWISRLEGASWIDPNRILRNVEPSRAYIDGVEADNQKLSMVSGAARIPPNTHSLRIDYTSPELTAPDRVTFRYRLVGIDEDWQVVGSRRFALYTDPPPGTYKFEVLAFNENGVSSGSPAKMSIAVIPMFYQTWWFKILCALVALVLVMFLYTRHLRHAREGLRLRLQTKHEERERIARELHDTLMQSMQGITLKVHAWSLDKTTNPARAEEMRVVSEVANDVLSEGRDRILDLRHTAESSRDLGNRLRAAGEKLLLLYHQKLSFDESGIHTALQEDAVEDIFQIGREAIRNAMVHAQSNVVFVSLHYGLRTLTLVVADDGIGLPLVVAETGLREGHWGLIGMRERAMRLHGRLSLGKREPAGTEVRLVVPAQVVYVDWLARICKAALNTLLFRPVQNTTYRRDAGH